MNIIRTAWLAILSWFGPLRRKRDLYDTAWLFARTPDDRMLRDLFPHLRGEF